MDDFDKLINNFITPTSVTAGVSTVVLGFFSNKLAPKLPPKMYKLLDNILVKMVIVAFLINQQIKKPSYSVIIAVGFVIFAELLVRFVAPDSPPLSEIVKPTEEEDKNKSTNNGGCNCYCGSTIVAPDNSKDAIKNTPNPGPGINNSPENYYSGSYGQRLQSIPLMYDNSAMNYGGMGAPLY